MLDLKPIFSHKSFKKDKLDVSGFRVVCASDSVGVDLAVGWVLVGYLERVQVDTRVCGPGFVSNSERVRLLEVSSDDDWDIFAPEEVE